MKTAIQSASKSACMLYKESAPIVSLPEPQSLIYWIVALCRKARLGGPGA